MIPEIRFWRVMRKPLGILLLSLLGLVAAFGVVHLTLDIAWASKVEKGISVLGIDLGAMNAEEARRTLEEQLDFARLESDIVMEFDGQSWNLPLARIDGYVDLDAMVDAALAAGRAEPFYARWLDRSLARGADRDLGIIYHYDEAKFHLFMEELQAAIDHEPVDAEIKLEAGVLVNHSAQDGWLLDREAATEEILAAFSYDDHRAVLPIAVTPPQVHNDQIGKVIVVNLATHRLTLYSDMEVEKEYPIACGTASWPTPKGTWKVTSKQKNPTWSNPGSSWAVDMPPFIPPGPGNPLGTRAIGTSAPGVFIHGTYNSWSIGTSASHGCIRMYIKDSEDIFERVEVGIPVLIWAG
ncbi:MAG: L,D-transpeptidase family protein [Candidatus Geothermincolia bacterium]